MLLAILSPNDSNDNYVRLLKKTTNYLQTANLTPNSDPNWGEKTLLLGDN